MVSTRKSAAFPMNGRMYPKFLGDVPPGEADATDNPDGVVNAYGLGCYEVGGPKGRIDSQGAGTPKGGVGNASGMGKATRVTSGTR